jgi:hypothetical protein
MKSKLFILLALIAIVETSKQCKYIDVQGARYPNIVLMPAIDSLFNKFTEGVNLKDSVSIFVILKNIDANSLKIYFVAKKPLRSDFEFIGIPVTTFQKNGRDFYVYTGLEKITRQDTTFWSRHIEIYDDRIKQSAGLYETSIVKKELYIIEDGKSQRVQPFEDVIFVGNPVDTIKFR